MGLVVVSAVVFVIGLAAAVVTVPAGNEMPTHVGPNGFDSWLPKWAALGLFTVAEAAGAALQMKAGSASLSFLGGLLLVLTPVFLLLGLVMRRSRQP